MSLKDNAYVFERYSNEYSTKKELDNFFAMTIYNFISLLGIEKRVLHNISANQHLKRKICKLLEIIYFYLRALKRTIHASRNLQLSQLDLQSCIRNVCIYVYVNDVYVAKRNILHVQGKYLPEAKSNTTELRRTLNTQYPWVS